MIFHSEVLEGVKALKKNGWSIDLIESLFINRLKVDRREKDIPDLKKEIEIIKEELKL